MQTILEILRLAGRLKPGFCLSNINEPYMRLAIEDTQIPGPDGHPSLSVAHYGEQNLRAQGFVEAFRRMQAAETTRQ